MLRFSCVYLREARTGRLTARRDKKSNRRNSPNEPFYFRLGLILIKDFSNGGKNDIFEIRKIFEIRPHISKKLPLVPFWVAFSVRIAALKGT